MWQTILIVAAATLTVFLYWKLSPTWLKVAETRFVKDLVWAFRITAREIMHARKKIVATGIVTDEELVKLLQQLDAILKKLQQ